MPYTEFVSWIHFFEEYPEGWKEDDRAFKIANVTAMSFGGKSLKPEDLFPSLKRVHKKSNAFFKGAVGGAEIPD